MIHHRKDLPSFDPKKLRLPRSPRVLELHAQRYTAAGDDEWLNVWVVVDALTPVQRKDFAWTIPIQTAILRELARQDDERFPVLFFRERADWKGIG